MGFLSEERASSVQNKSLNLKQTPADIWEYEDANKTDEPVLSLKSPWKFLQADIEKHIYKPPIGIPTFWFTSVLPDWALDCTDGATGYEFDDYPELDNEIFRQFLADFSDFDSADDTTTFDMPDLQGMFMRLAGTSSMSAYYIGGAVGDYSRDYVQYHDHYTYHSTDDHYHGLTSFQSTDDRSYARINMYTYGATGSFGNETKPCSFTGTMIVRFE